jgi:type I restriction-modification system DNA methylase subunit
MSLFQKSVLNKFIKSQDNDKIKAAYQRFSEIFLQEDRQSEIRAMKEEEYQDGFLDDLFVNVLGYIKRPNKGFNLVREKKNEADSKKADGAILKNDSPLAVIELKGTDTTDLDKVTNQGFGYKNNHKECIYVVISNFEKLRFFIHHAVDYVEFNLFTLSEEEFTTLWLCLHSDNLLDNIPSKIKAESLVEEEDITKNLYKDYSAFKQELWQDIVKYNPSGDPLVFYKKTQKLIDRFLFIFFAEDAGLLPPNSISRMVDRWKMLKEEDAYKPLYEIFKQYFGYINTGRPGKAPQDEIYAYNGGLMAEDDILETVIISDDVLLIHVTRLTTYDFSSEVDVNILGHIFENSLNDIEAVTAQLEGQEIDKSKTKRKKDGVFYTPKYITKYIVDNTIGKLCEEKKTELGIIDEEYAKGRKNRKTDTIKKLDQSLQAYREWLLNITICDPACGSGAFLNQALEFLMKEHAYIDELYARLFGASIVFQDVRNHILEKNIFGVDINDESVEIAKLSLWLRTAERGRKLTSLNNNIKCGNSLIDDPEVAGEKAFNWQKEFPTVFEKGGFDVVIGNPPYVNANDIKKNSTELEYNFLKKSYKTAKGTVDLYIYFFEKGLDITRKNGCLSYITPNRFLSASYGKAFREYLLSNFKLLSLVDYSDKAVFQDASTYPVITFISNQTSESNYNVVCGKFHDTTRELISNNYPSDQLDILDDSILGFLLNDKIDITLKVFNQSVPLSESADINATSTASEAENYSSLINENSGFKLVNTGTIDPFITTWGINELTDKGNKYLNPYLPANSTFISLNRNKLYSNPKIIISKIGLSCEAFYDMEGAFASINTNCLYNFNENYSPEYILCWLNSKLYNFTFECLFDGLRMSGGYLLYSAPNLKNTKIKSLNEELQKPFVTMANLITDLLGNFQNISNKFSKYVREKYNLEKLPGKLEKWYLLEFADFIKELNKALKVVNEIPLTKKDEFEWMELFEDNKKKVLELKTQIDQTDKEIDRMVYELYGLTDEEILIVEGNVTAPNSV